MDEHVAKSSSDEGELTDSDNEGAAKTGEKQRQFFSSPTKSYVSDVANVTKSPQTIKEIPDHQETIPDKHDVKEIDISESTDIPCTSTEQQPTEDVSVTSEQTATPAAPEKKMTVLERLKAMKFGTAATNKVEIFTLPSAPKPPSAASMLRPLNQPALNIDDATAPITMSGKAQRRQRTQQQNTSNTNRFHDWDTPDDNFIENDNAYDQSVRAHRNEMNENSAQRLLQSKPQQQYRRSFPQFDPCVSGRQRYGDEQNNNYGRYDMQNNRNNSYHDRGSSSDDEDIEEEKPIPQLTNEEIDERIADLSLDWNDLMRIDDWDTLKHIVLKLRDKNQTMLTTLNEHDQIIGNLQSELQEERAALNLPPSKHANIIDSNMFAGHVDTNIQTFGAPPTIMQQPLDLSSFVPSVPTPATFWSSFMQQLGNLGGSTSQPPSATKVVVIDTTAPPPNTHNIPPPPQFLTASLAQAFGMPKTSSSLPNPTVQQQQPVAAPMSAAKLLDTVRMMIRPPNVGAMSVNQPVQIRPPSTQLNPVQQTLVPVPQTVADIRQSNIVPVTKRPRLDASTKLPVGAKRTFKKKKSMLSVPKVSTLTSDQSITEPVISEPNTATVDTPSQDSIAAELSPST